MWNNYKDHVQCSARKETKIKIDELDKMQHSVMVYGIT